MKLSIAARIGLGFGIIIIAVIVNVWMTITALQNSKNVNDNITFTYTPSSQLVNELKNMIGDSRMLIKSWVHIDRIADTPDKLKLKDLHARGYRELMDSLNYFSKLWEKDDRKDLSNLLFRIDSTIVDSLFPNHQYIMESLGTFESYDESNITFEMIFLTEENGDIMLLTNRILNDISQLANEIDQQVASGRDDMVKTFGDFKNRIIIMGLILAFGGIVIAFLTINSLAVPINKTKNILLLMSKGILPKEKLKESKDEIGQMAKALNLLVQALKDIFNFSLQIGKGNFDTEFKSLSDEDILGNSLIEMRNELKKANEEEKKRKIDDEHRNWTSQGVAKFSDILRKNSDNLDELSYNIISNLVKYTESNQGGIFIVNDNDRDKIVLEMKACYAFDRQKFIKQTIEIGEGLVGRCYQEKEKIFLTEIPNNYIRITSGLGDQNPNCLLLVPLTYNDFIYGIIEIASFKVFESFEVEFIERISESIAATISSVKANIQTTILLEQSQQQAEEMSAQEEEMRQNMEELRATQEQSTRREEELRREVDELRKRIKQLSEEK